MNTSTLLKAYFSPKGDDVPNLNRLESKLQPIGARRRRRRPWILPIGAAIFVAISFLLLRRVVPVVSEQFPLLLDGLPLEVQIISFAVVMPAVAISIGVGTHRLFRMIARRRAIEVYLQGIKDSRKLMVYVSGSGALGFCRAVERFSCGNPIKNLLIFAHPPIAAIKQGSLKVMGAITAYAPVQFAMGSHKAAATARGAEAQRYNEAHSAFLDATGANKTAVEWSVIHIGEGHTSVSCHTEWEQMRTTAHAGASPGRFVVVVQDSVSLITPIEDETSEISSEHGGVSNDAPYISDYVAHGVVKVLNDQVVGSGVIIDPDGFILTASHVVGDSKTVLVRSADGVDATAELVQTNQEGDVALLCCPDLKGAASVKRGDSSKLNVGDVVAAFGYPADAADQRFPEIHMGIISNLFSDATSTLVQATVAVSPGCSGGPLVTTDGRFIGLITSKHRTSESPVERTLALSSNDVFDILEAFASEREVAIAAD